MATEKQLDITMESDVEFNNPKLVPITHVNNMEKITVGKAGKDFIESIKKRKKEINERLDKRMPNEEMRKIIEQKVEETDKLNKDNSTWDKASFRLGMYSMYYILTKDNQPPQP